MNNCYSFLSEGERKSFIVREDGLIHHLFMGRSLKNLVNRLRYARAYRRNPEAVIEKERGYHLYVLFALARCSLQQPKHHLFNSNKFKKSLEYLKNDYALNLESNRYSYYYNSPGLELPLIYLAFRNEVPFAESKLVEYYNIHKNLTWCKETGLFCRGSEDPATSAARFYEIAVYLSYASEM